MEALGSVAFPLATLSENPTSALAESCPRCWLNRSVAVLGTVVVPSDDRPLLGTATAPTWQRVLASSCRRDDRSRGIGFESPATGWVADTVAQRSESAVEGGLSQVLRTPLPITQKPLAAAMSRGSVSGMCQVCPSILANNRLQKTSNKLLTSANWLVRVITGYKKELTTNV